MTTGKGVAIGGGLIALAVLFSGGDGDSTSTVPVTAEMIDIEVEPKTESVREIDTSALDGVIIETTNQQQRADKERELEALWEQGRSEAQAAAEASVAPSAFTPPLASRYSCNCSKTCTQMSSCNEAYFQLNSCGCTRRDGDNDGIPCESICN